MSKYFRKDEYTGATPIEEAIEELQEAVENLNTLTNDLNERLEAEENRNYQHQINSQDTYYYVDCVDGSDDNDGSENAPFKNIDMALEKLNTKYNSVQIILKRVGEYRCNLIKYLTSGVTLHIYGESTTPSTFRPESYIILPVSRETGTKNLTFYNSRLHFENCSFDNREQGGNIVIEGCSIYTKYCNWYCGGDTPYFVCNSTNWQMETQDFFNCQLSLNNGATIRARLGIIQDIDKKGPSISYQGATYYPAIRVLANSQLIINDTHNADNDFDLLYYVYDSKLTLQSIDINANTKNIVAVFSFIFSSSAIRESLGYTTAIQNNIWVDRPEITSNLARD